MTKSDLLAHPNLSPLAKLLAVWLSEAEMRAYDGRELSRVFGIPASWIVDAGRELSIPRVGLCKRHPAASIIEWSGRWQTKAPQAPTATAKGSSPSSKRARSDLSVEPSS